jgi:hypothetical protein
VATWPEYLCSRILHGERPVLPHIARQIQSDVVVSVTERRIDEHLGQWPAQASREEIGIETIQVGSDNIRIGLGRRRRPK